MHGFPMDHGVVLVIIVKFVYYVLECLVLLIFTNGKNPSSIMIFVKQCMV